MHVGSPEPQIAGEDIYLRRTKPYTWSLLSALWKSALVHGKVMEMQLSCMTAHMPGKTDQAILLPEQNWCPETKQHETWQRSHPENPALHIQSFRQKMPLIFMGAFVLYFKQTGAVSLKLNSHPKKYFCSEILGRIFAWSHQSFLPYLSSLLRYHQHG